MTIPGCMYGGTFVIGATRIGRSGDRVIGRSGNISSVFRSSDYQTIRLPDQVCSTPTLNSGTSGFRAAASRAVVMASRVSTGSMILSIHKRAAP